MPFSNRPEVLRASKGESGSRDARWFESQLSAPTYIDIWVANFQFAMYIGCMFSRLFTGPEDSSYFLLGPRGTGKSTWLRQRHPSPYVDLLASDAFNRLTADPGRLREWVPPGHSGFIVIDEIQKVPSLLDEVHRLIELEGWRFILTGSSARKLRRGGVNLLAGRALTYWMHPLTAIELGDSFDFERSLLFGHLPMAVTSRNPKRYLSSYVQTYLREEVQQEGFTRNLGAFTRFLEAASLANGAVLNKSSVARECAVDRKVVESYFSIVEDLLLGQMLPAFTKRARRRLTQHPKFYFFDVGVFRAIRPAGPLDSPEEIDGAALETLVLQELRAINHYHDLRFTLSYWRTSTGLEVDFVLYGERGLIAIEVKRTGRLRRRDFRGLAAFKRDYPMARTLMLYGGPDRRYSDGVEVVPLAEALAALPELLTSPTH